MSGDPQRPYAQLLTPAAKSQKLLLRLQHKKILPSASIVHVQDTLTVWQKLLAKNIPSCPWPDFADLMMFLDEEYLAVIVWPFENKLSLLEAALSERFIAGYLLIDGRADAPWISSLGQRLVISVALVDRIGQQSYLQLAKALSEWQTDMLSSLHISDQDAALDMIQLLRQRQEPPWKGRVPQMVGFSIVARIYFRLWRAQGNYLSLQRLIHGPQEQVAADWLVENVVGAENDDKGYRLVR